MFTLGIRTRLKSLELVTIILVNTPHEVRLVQHQEPPEALRVAYGSLLKRTHGSPYVHLLLFFLLHNMHLTHRSHPAPKLPRCMIQGTAWGGYHLVAQDKISEALGGLPAYVPR